MDEPPARAIGSVTRYVNRVADRAVADHEQRCHAIPPPDDAPINAVPFPHVRLDDDQVCHALERLEDDDEDTVAAALGVPLMALQLAIADYRRRHQRFLRARAGC